MARIRMWVAKLLDRRKDTYWANVAMWAMGYASLKQTFGRNGNWNQQLCERGSTYCGKCEVSGRFKC